MTKEHPGSQPRSKPAASNNRRKARSTNNTDSTRSTEQDEIASYIPSYLRRIIAPHHGDFCYTRIFHFRLVAQLMAEGFLPIATQGVLLPKLHGKRCVIPLPESLHVSTSVRKKSKRFTITINQEFERVVKGCREQHGRSCWLYPPLVAAFQAILQAGQVDAIVMNDQSDATAATASQQQSPVRLYSIEIWNASSGELAGGELGYTVGSIYTSLTGFSSQDSAGSVQLAALGRMLCEHGFSLWDLGMEMEYKIGLGSTLMPRKEFVRHVHSVRCTKGDLVLPVGSTKMNARELIDYKQNQKPATKIHSKAPHQVQSITPSKQLSSSKHKHACTRVSNHEESLHEKKKMRNSDTSEISVVALSVRDDHPESSSP